MAIFYYHAVNPAGAEQKGSIEADTAKQARERLREQGLLPIALRTENVRLFWQRLQRSRRNSISSLELALITRQLATLIAAGLPLTEVLNAVAEQSTKANTRAILLAVRNKVVAGFTLAAALREMPDAFSELYCATIAAGEQSGHLALVLQRLADYTEQQYQIRQKIQHALIYPTIMLCVACSIVYFLLAYVVPKMMMVYSDLNQELPWLTQCLLAVSSVLQEYGIYIILSLTFGILCWRYQLKRNEQSRITWQRLLLRLPLIGYAIKTINTARFAKTVAILSTAGIPIIDAMQTAAPLVTSIPIRQRIATATQQVREGATINKALHQTRYFPPLSIHLIASGEASGQLAAMLERAAINQDAEITRLIATSLALFEPAIILIMGLVVLFIVLAILLPIFNLDQMVG